MIASFMGHASLDMLLKRYGHFTDETRREAILKFDQPTLRRNEKGCASLETHWMSNGAQSPKWDFKNPVSHCKIKRETGLEPATFSLGSWHSTNWATPAYSLGWCFFKNTTHLLLIRLDGFLGFLPLAWGFTIYLDWIFKILFTLRARFFMSGSLLECWNNKSKLR